MVPSASIPAVRQNRSKLTETASQALSTAPIPVGGKAVNGVIAFFMALLSFRGISTPSLPAQGEQRRSSYFNIPRGNSEQRGQVGIVEFVVDDEADIDGNPGLIVVDGDGMAVPAGPQFAVINGDRIIFRQGPGRGIAGNSRSDHRDPHSV